MQSMTDKKRDFETACAAAVKARHFTKRSVPQIAPKSSCRGLLALCLRYTQAASGTASAPMVTPTAASASVAPQNSIKFGIMSLP